MDPATKRRFGRVDLDVQILPGHPQAALAIELHTGAGQSIELLTPVHPSQTRFSG